MLMWLYYLNLIFAIPVALCLKTVPCDSSDDRCITASYKIILNKIIAGNPILNLKSSDPLHQDKIQVNVPHMNITLTDPYMYGLAACEIHEVKLTPEKWVLSIVCPKMTLESDYEINGDVDSVHIEGKGRCEIIYEKYFIGMDGGYTGFADKNGVEHAKVTFYNMNFTEVQGRVTYNFTNLFDGDKEKSVKVHEYINKNWKKLHNIIGTPIIYSLFGYFIDNVNEYLALVPKPQVYTKRVSVENLPVTATIKI